MTTITTRSLPLIPLTIPLNQLSSKSMSPQSMHPHARAKRSQSCDNLDEISESRSSPVSSIQNSENYPKEIDDDEDADNEIDRISCCSDDSELSVGKEDDLEPTNKISENSLLSERRSSMDTTVTEDISNDSITLINRSLPASSPQSDNLIRFPIVRPSPTRFQEEFLRSSQLYAEELMKQQMSIVAAARGLPLTSTSTPTITQKFGFRPHLKSPTSTTNLLPHHLDHESLNFRGIHSHLNAISQITQNLSNISKITATSIDSRENSQSPPTSHNNNNNNNNNHSSAHHLNHAHHHNLNHHQLNHNQLNQLNLHNNNLNDSNLKFSIDNILKADFGRRITEPLKRTSKSSSLAHKRNHKKNNNNNSSSNNNNNNNEINSGSSSNSNNNILAPIDLTAAQEKLSDNLNRVSTGSVNSINSGNNNNNNNSVEDIPSSTSSTSSSTTNNNSDGPMVWPAWVYCTRYSDRPSSGTYITAGGRLSSQGPRTRRPKKPPGEKITADEKRPRTAFSGPQLARLKHEFNENRYLTERRRQQLSSELGLNEAQIKIWFQNKRAKIKKSSGQKNPLALQLMAQGLYNHSTVPLTREEEELQQLQEQAGNV